MLIDPWISIDQVGLVCSACAESMKKKGMTAIRASVLKDAKITWQECMENARKNTSVKYPEALCGWLKHYNSDV